MIIAFENDFTMNKESRKHKLHPSQIRFCIEQLHIWLQDPRAARKIVKVSHILFDSEIPIAITTAAKICSIISPADIITSASYYDALSKF